MNKRIDEAARAYENLEGRDEDFWHPAKQELLNVDRGSSLRTPDSL
ncbi:hypothetical protein NLM27_41305 [Bradyrhizobium sp. CCGB12]|nr:hypothetical protein [Bradyrhizobium sp. CCGB12]MCP3395184.1 hypothetical protein [Bradyrhizobium sp. CCGB12]